MMRFREAIEDSGFAAFYLTLTPGNLRSAQWAAYSKALSGKTKDLAEFFLLGERFSRTKLDELVSKECADILISARIVSSQDDYVVLGEFRLLCWEGVFFFAQISFKPSVYYGTDSLALNVQHSYFRGSRALDLCAGPGIQALTLARRGFTVDAVEFNPAAIAVGRVNVALNGLEDKITYHQADVAEYVSTPRNVYDVVVMNPPLLPIAADLAFPFVGDGGEDGQNLAKVVLENSHNLFAGKRSRLIFVGLTPRRRDGSVVVAEYLEKICAEKTLVATLFLLGRHPTIPGNFFFDGYVRSLQIYNSESASPDEVLIKVAEYLRRNRIHSMDQYFAIAATANGAGPSVVTNDLGALGVPDWFS